MNIFDQKLNIFSQKPPQSHFVLGKNKKMGI